MLERKEKKQDKMEGNAAKKWQSYFGHGEGGLEAVAQPGLWKIPTLHDGGTFACWEKLFACGRSLTSLQKVTCDGDVAYLYCE